jgi:hypothetical protein
MGFVMELPAAVSMLPIWLRSFLTACRMPAAIGLHLRGATLASARSLLQQNFGNVPDMGAARRHGRLLAYG